jgi:hypothetical protein
MKFSCPKRIEIDYIHWYKWFAWYPVRVGDNDCRWLEFVYRKAIPKTYDDQGRCDVWQPYEYREY